MAKKQEKEKYKLLFWLFSLSDLMEALFRKYPADSTISSFCRKLRRYGFRYIRDGKDYRYFCQQHPKETRDLVLEYYDNAINYYDKEELLGCLYSKEHLDLFYFMLDILIENGKLQLEESCTCELISHLLYTTKDRKYKDSYINYLLIHKGQYWIGGYNSDIIKICGYYQFAEAREYLREEIKYLYYNDHNIIWHALKQYHNPEDKKLLERYGLTTKKNSFDLDILEIEKRDEEMKKKGYPEGSTIPIFISEMRNIFKLTDDFDAQLYCQTHADDTREMVIKFYNKAIIPSDQRYYLRCLDGKDNKELFDFLIHELKKHASLGNDFRGIVDASGGYFYYIYDKRLEEEYIRVFIDKKIPYIIRGYISDSLIKIHSPKIASYMLDIVKDENHPFVHIALEYFSKHKDVEEYKEIFEQYKTDQYPMIREFARAGLKRIKKKQKL